MWVANLRSSMRGRQQQLAQPRKMAWQPRSSDFGTTFQDRNGDKGTVGHSSSQKVTTSRKMTGAANVSSAACLSLQCSAAAAKMTPLPRRTTAKCLPPCCLLRLYFWCQNFYWHRKVPQLCHSVSALLHTTMVLPRCRRRAATSVMYLYLQ